MSAENQRGLMLPWVFEEYLNKGVFEIIGTAHYPDQTTKKTIARIWQHGSRNIAVNRGKYLCHAANCHHELLEALKDLTAELGSTGIFADWPDLKAQVDAAITKAEGQS